MTYTEANFERLSWHDCHIWAIDFRTRGPGDEDWTSDLVFDIDFIVEWICGVDGTAQFLVAPAALAFHGVTDANIAMNWGASGHQTALHPVSIGRVEREQIQNRKVFLDRPYYSWKIFLNWPNGSEISFGAVGFTQTLLSEPVLTSEQSLSRRQRDELKRLS